MKIAIDVSQMGYTGTGVARYVSGLTHALLLANTSHEFVLYAGTLRNRSFFTRLSKIEPWNRATWKIFPLPPTLAGYALSDTSIPFEYLTGPVDLVHASDWSQPSAKAPIVTTVHDLIFKKYPETVDPIILKAQEKRLAKVAKSETFVIADSESTKNDLMEIYHIHSQRIKVIYPGIDPQFAPQSKNKIDQVKKKYNLPDEFVFSLSTQEPRKNIQRLVSALAGFKLPLVIAGKHGWGDKTSSIGFVPDEDLPALYASSSAFVYPSLYEGFGFPVLEAMASGTVVVTSNTSSLPEIAGKAAILIDPESEDSIRQGVDQALASRGERIKLGYKQAENFTWQNCARGVIEVYEKIGNRN